MPRNERPSRLGMRRLHMASALLVGLFLLLHMANHLVGLRGQEAHVAFMGAVRPVYRQPVVETLLIGLIFWQVGSGLTMLARGWKSRSSAVAWLQALSGAYLAFFLVNHLAAVLAGRYVFGLDTDFRFAAAGFFAPPWQLFFAPYYFLGVACLFLHVGCAVYWNLGAERRKLATGLLAGMALAGLAFAGLTVLALSGRLHPVTVPAEYLATFGR